MSAVAHDANLSWGIKASFLNYLLNMPESEITRTGLVQNDLAFEFPLVGVDIVDGRHRFRFSGSIRFAGHGGMLDVLLAQPVLVVDARGMGELELEGPVVGDTHVRAFDVVNIHQVAGIRSFRTSLRPEATEWFFDNYPAGTAFDDIHVSGIDLSI